MLNYQTEKFQYWQQEIKISCRIFKSTPQPLTWPHGPGRGRRGTYRFEPEIKAAEEAEMQGAVLGAVAGFALPMITTMLNKDSATMTGTFIIIFILNLLFLVVLFGRKETCLNTLRLVHHALAVSHSPRAGPGPCRRVRAWRVDYALALRRRTISVGW